MKYTSHRGNFEILTEPEGFIPLVVGAENYYKFPDEKGSDLKGNQHFYNKPLLYSYRYVKFLVSSSIVKLSLLIKVRLIYLISLASTEDL